MLPIALYRQRGDRLHRRARHQRASAFVSPDPDPGTSHVAHRSHFRNHRIMVARVDGWLGVTHNGARCGLKAHRTIAGQYPVDPPEQLVAPLKRKVPLTVQAMEGARLDGVGVARRPIGVDETSLNQLPVGFTPGIAVKVAGENERGGTGQLERRCALDEEPTTRTPRPFAPGTVLKLRIQMQDLAVALTAA